MSKTKMSGDREAELDNIILSMRQNFYTIREACKILGLSGHTIRKYVFCARHPNSRHATSQQKFAHWKWGNYVAIPKEVVEAYQRNRRPKGRPRKPLPER